MHLKTCCALLLLALVACQAAPSPKTEEKPIEAKSTEELSEIEETGEEKERSKKSTTVCMEFSSGKEQQVPCDQVQQSAAAVFVQEPIKPVYYLSQPTQQGPQSQTIVVPAAPVQPTSQTHIIVQEQPQQQQNVVVPAPQVIQQPSYIQIVQPQPQSQAKPQPQLQPQPQPQQTVQVQTRPVQVQTRPSVQVQPTQTVQVKPQPIQVQRPTVQVVQPQPVPQHTHVIQVQSQPPQQNTVVVPSAPVSPPKTQVVIPSYKVESAPCASEVVIQQPQVELIPQVIQQQPTIIEVPYGVSEQSEDELYECSCHPGKQALKSKYPKLTDILTVYPGSVVSGVPLVSGGPLLSSQIASSVSARASLEPISTSASLGPISSSTSFGPISGSASLGLAHNAAFKTPFANLNGNVAPANLGFAEARRHKHKTPAKLSVQIPVSTVPVAPVSPVAPAISYSAPVQYYTLNTYPFDQTYSAPTSYNPNSYYYSYTNSYPSETSAPAITVNASGPFYRESQHATDNKEMPTTDKPQILQASTSSNLEDNTNKKRETDLIQLNTVTQEQKVEQNSV